MSCPIVLACEFIGAPPDLHFVNVASQSPADSRNSCDAARVRLAERMKRNQNTAQSTGAGDMKGISTCVTDLGRRTNTSN